MGGNYYDGDVDDRSSSARDDYFDYHGYSEESDEPESREVHTDLNPKGVDIKCMDLPGKPITTPIVIAMDVTRSRGDDAKIIFNKLPMFIGQLIMKGYVSNPVISFSAIGDATFGDQAPIQVCRFESDNRLDEELGKIWLEEGGGGTGQESYELMAYYYVIHSILDANKRGKKGYFFFLGDEGFYPFVDKNQIKTFIGDDAQSNIDTKDIFRKLQEKYHVFLIYPKKSWKERKDDIDAEIRKRVEKAGGMYDNVDVRATLIWNNRNDLDIHVICPSGEEIWYSHMVSRCGGRLDIDKNVRGETMKPVENVRWAKGQAPKGHYKVFVQNYATHGGFEAATDFKIEIEVNGKIQHFKGRTPERRTGSGSDTDVCEFDYDPNERPIESNDYAGYNDDNIITQWSQVIPSENILLIDDPKAIVDVMMGALALMEGTDIDNYIVDMNNRGQTLLRQSQTKNALVDLAKTNMLVKVEPGRLPSNHPEKRRKSKSSRL